MSGTSDSLEAIRSKQSALHPHALCSIQHAVEHLDAFGR